MAESIKVYGIFVFRMDTDKDGEKLVASYDEYGCHERFAVLYFDKEEARKQASALNNANIDHRSSHQFSVRELTVI